MDVALTRVEDSWLPPRILRSRQKSLLSLDNNFNRPKSVPVNPSNRKTDIHCQLQAPTLSSRPKTSVNGSRKECQRLLQLENEPDRKRLHKSVLTSRINSPSYLWQKQLDDTEMIPCVVGPGYVLSRNKSKIHVQLNESEIQTSKSIENVPKSFEIGSSAERDRLISLLQQQIDDLMLSLEEEKLNHRQTKRQASEYLKSKTEELTNYYKKEIESVDESHLKKMTTLRDEHINEMSYSKNRYDSEIKKLRQENDLLQAAFETYRQQITNEMNEKWSRRLEERTKELQDDSQRQLTELRTRLITEKLTEKADLENVYQERLSRMRRDNKQQLEELMNRFSENVTDMEKLKQTETCLQETQKEFDRLQDIYQNKCMQLDNSKLEIDKMKVKLIEWENSFETRTKQMDEKYREEIDDKKRQINEMRIIYMKKCSELLDARYSANTSLDERIVSAKDTMRVIIETRAKAMVSLATADNVNRTYCRWQPKVRPTSAPVSRSEIESALFAAGQTSS